MGVDFFNGSLISLAKNVNLVVTIVCTRVGIIRINDDEF